VPQSARHAQGTLSKRHSGAALSEVYEEAKISIGFKSSELTEEDPELVPTERNIIDRKSTIFSRRVTERMAPSQESVPESMSNMDLDTGSSLTRGPCVHLMTFSPIGNLRNI